MDKLSDAEWKILDLLWKNGPMTLMEITHALEDETHWKRTTIVSFLKRMEAKGAIYHIEGERAKMFYPKEKQSEETLKETRSFLDKVFRGNVGLMLSNMIEQDALSEQEIEELTEILKGAEK
ncbi:MAG: BlaI/MecI/CopY family transcriptional regulator [Lachnospiraceae bacterium]|nr:BlaI/MecI/CopY family transcriptional regulator [Lachnospiraceae bacterium]